MEIFEMTALETAKKLKAAKSLAAMPLNLLQKHKCKRRKV